MAHHTSLLPPAVSPVMTVPSCAVSLNFLKPAPARRCHSRVLTHHLFCWTDRACHKARNAAAPSTGGTLRSRSEPSVTASRVPFTLAKCDPQLPPFPPSSLPSQLRGFVDASRANDLRNRSSAAGRGFCLASGVVACRCHAQTLADAPAPRLSFLLLLKLPRL